MPTCRLCLESVTKTKMHNGKIRCDNCIDSTIKKCLECNVFRPFTEFGLRQGRCKDCRSKYIKGRYSQNNENYKSLKDRKIQKKEYFEKWHDDETENKCLCGGLLISKHGEYIPSTIHEKSKRHKFYIDNGYPKYKQKEEEPQEEQQEDDENYEEVQQQDDQSKLGDSISCDCGGKYKSVFKSRHEVSNKHRKWECANS